MKKKAQKLKAKAVTSQQQAKELAKAGAEFTKHGEIMNKKLEDVKSGKLQAGRDFISYNKVDLDAASVARMMLLPTPFSGTQSFGVIEKGKGSTDLSYRYFNYKYKK